MFATNDYTISDAVRRGKVAKGQPADSRSLASSLSSSNRAVRRRKKVTESYQGIRFSGPQCCGLRIGLSRGTATEKFFCSLLSTVPQAECSYRHSQRRIASHHLNGEDVEMNIPEQMRRDNSLPLPSEEVDSQRSDEARKIRRLQMMISMVMSVIGQDPNLTIEEASELAAGAKRAALAMFPDKELAFDLLYKPRLQRLIRERFPTTVEHDGVLVPTNCKRDIPSATA